MCSSDLASTGGRTALKKLQTYLGVNYEPHGVLFDRHLMTKILSPSAMYIRDWMHTYASNGVAGTHVALVVNKLGTVGCGIEVVQDR